MIMDIKINQLVLTSESCVLGDGLNKPGWLTNSEDSWT